MKRWTGERCQGSRVVPIKVSDSSQKWRHVFIFGTPRDKYRYSVSGRFGALEVQAYFFYFTIMAV